MRVSCRGKIAASCLPLWWPTILPAASPSLKRERLAVWTRAQSRSCTAGDILALLESEREARRLR